MSTKKLTASILLLVIGGLLIPSGFVINDYLRNEVSKGVPEALLGIKDQVEPELEENVKVLGIPTVLSGIRDGALPEIENMVESEAILEILKTVKGMAIPVFDDNVKTQAIPEVLGGIKTQIIPEIENLVNFTAYLNTLNETKTQFIPEIENMINFTAYLETLNETKSRAMGALPDIVNGSTAAKLINQTIDFLGYITFSGDLTLGKEHFFNNKTIQKNTTCPVQGVSENMTSGMLNLSYTRPGQDYLLYGNPIYGLPGLITDTDLGIGLLEFMGYYALGAAGNVTIQGLMKAGYNTTWANLGAIAGYIQNYLWTVEVPFYVPLMYGGMTPSQLAVFIFYAQWANATISEDGLDMSLFIEGYDDPLYGFEAGIPIKTNISYMTALDLWDHMNSSSFVNDTGLMVWLGALAGDPASYIALKTTFGLNDTQMGIVLGWLYNWMLNIAPILFETEKGISLEAAPEIIFYEQWANGTILGEVMFPLGLNFNEFLGLPGTLYGFEVGIYPYGSNISLTTAIDLWNSSYSYSLINSAGLMVWLGALAGDPASYAVLNTTLGLGNDKMNALLGWLYSWTLIVAPTLFSYEYLITLDAAPEYMFYEQWTNGTMLGEEMFPGGIDFSDFIGDLVGPVIGFEVGLPPNPSNISYTSAKALWDISNPYSFINTTTGFGSWYLASEGNTTIESLLNATFGLASGQIELILPWLFTIVKENIVPPFFALPVALGGYGMTTTVYAEILVYEQWANGTIQGIPQYPDGIDLPISGGEALKGLFEVGVPTSSGISLTACYALWDDTNPSSFVNDTGLLKWRDAATELDIWLNLSGTFGLDISQMGLMLDWLEDIIDIFVPALFADPTLGRGMTIPSYAKTLFYEQWANGTILGEAVYPQGLDLGGGLTGFEVGIPTESNISLAVCELLWNEVNGSTFVNDTGIDKWLDAATDTTVQTELRTTFGLDTTQMSLILDWLWENSFKDDVVPILAAEELGMSLSDYAEVLFFEQWANCTILGEKMFPEGIVLPFDNITGLEVGCPTASSISLSVAEILFDKRNSSSIVDPSGLQKWYKAADSSSNEYTELKATFGLSNTQMGMMTTWITNFRDNVVPVLAKEEMGLPADPYTLGSGIFMGMAVGGVCLAALGVVVLILSRRT